MFQICPEPKNNNFWSSRSEVFCKKLFLKISQNSLGKACARVSFLIKLQASGTGKTSKKASSILKCKPSMPAKLHFSKDTRSCYYLWNYLKFLQKAFSKTFQESYCCLFCYNHFKPRKNLSVTKGSSPNFASNIKPSRPVHFRKLY